MENEKSSGGFCLIMIIAIILLSIGAEYSKTGSGAPFFIFLLIVAGLSYIHGMQGYQDS